MPMTSGPPSGAPRYRGVGRCWRGVLDPANADADADFVCLHGLLPLIGGGTVARPHVGGTYCDCIMIPPAGPDDRSNRFDRCRILTEQQHERNTIYTYRVHHASGHNGRPSVRVASAQIDQREQLRAHAIDKR